MKILIIEYKKLSFKSQYSNQCNKRLDIRPPCFLCGLTLITCGGMIFYLFFVPLATPQGVLPLNTQPNAES